MNKRMLLPLLLLAAAVPGCGRADALACANVEIAPDTGIEACTRELSQAGLDPAARADAHYNRAIHYQRANRHDEAVADFDRSLHQSPDRVHAILYRGASHGMAGRSEAALRDFDRVIALKPDEFAAHINRGKMLSDLGRFRESLPALDRAVALSPEEWVAYDGRCWSRAVLAEDLEGALRDCDRAHALAPDAANPLNNRGLVNYRSKRYQASIDDYTASIALDPGVASSYHVRGLARLALGQTDKAEADFAKAASIEPGVAERYAGYGVAKPR